MSAKPVVVGVLQEERAVRAGGRRRSYRRSFEPVKLRVVLAALKSRDAGVKVKRFLVGVAL